MVQILPLPGLEPQHVRHIARSQTPNRLLYPVDLQNTTGSEVSIPDVLLNRRDFSSISDRHQEEVSYKSKHHRNAQRHPSTVKRLFGEHWKWKWHDPRQSRLTLNGLQGAISQKTEVLMNTAVRTETKRFVEFGTRVATTPDNRISGWML
jgi:hypothetical protein